MCEDTNRKLYDSARAYVQKVLGTLAKECSDSDANWVQITGDSEGAFTRVDKPVPAGTRFVKTHRKEIISLKEYTDFAAALRMDVEIAAQLDGWVETFAGFRLSEYEVVNRIVFQFAERRGGFVFDPVEFDRLFGRFIPDLKRTTFNCIAVAPILGFAAAGVTPIRLEERLEIDQLTDNEIRCCLTYGVPVHGLYGGMATVSGASGIRSRFMEVKRFRTTEQITSDLRNSSITESTRQQADQLLDVVHALRLFKSGQFSSPSMLLFFARLAV
jgi:hypothetical protein